MPQSNFRYDRDTLFKEFKVAKDADIKLSKKKTLEQRENDIYKNRIQFFKDHIALEKTNPEVYEGVDVKFDKLLNLYLTPNPRDAFYMAFFGKTYAEKRAETSETTSIED